MYFVFFLICPAKIGVRLSRDELISDVLLWTPTRGRAKAGRAARTYIQQLCEDTGCCPEDLPRAMNDREKWRQRVRDIRATSTTWWWWNPIYSTWDFFFFLVLTLNFQITYQYDNLFKFIGVFLLIMVLQMI